MSIFEYLTVAVSIVLALGIGKLTSSIPYVFDARRIDWLHALFFVLLFVSHIIVWWRVWLLNDITSWNILQFTILMGSPLSLYLTATALVSSNPEQVDDWQRYFDERSRWIMSGWAAIVLFGILRTYFVLSVPPAWWSFAILAIFNAAAISGRRIVHIVVIIPTLLSVGILLYRDFTAS